MALPEAQRGQSRPLEITDLLWSRDFSSDQRAPVDIEATAAILESRGQSRAARLVRRLPAQGGVLNEGHVDELMLRVHRELQRLEEELQLPRRIAEWLAGRTVTLLNQDARRPLRVVDVGCGLGYVTRWLSAHRPLGSKVELFGVDLNAVLIEEAQVLARSEQLDCQFVLGDAFAPGGAIDDPARTIVVSTGLLHHFDVDELPEFFSAQQRLGVAAFAHWDIDPSGWATLGAWVFHRGRMREPISRHDGVLSARRAHTARVLLAAAAAGAPDYNAKCQDGPRWRPTFSEVLRPISGDRAGS